MIRRPPRSTRTDTLFPDTTLFRSVDFVAVCHAIWKLGATPQPLSFRLPAAELAAIVALGKPSVVVGDRPAAEGVPVTSVDKIAAAGNDGADLPDAVAAVAKAPTSGGSTGRPKLKIGRAHV